MIDPYAVTAVAFMLMALFGGHAVADYGQQSAYVAEFKVRPTEDSARRLGADGRPVLPVVVPRNPDWFVTLAAHCLIHGFLVLAVVTPSAFGMQLLQGRDWLPSLRSAAMLGAWLGWAETVVHFAIDDAKGQQRFSYRIDQLLHYGCKMLWTVAVLVLVA